MTKDQLMQALSDTQNLLAQDRGRLSNARDPFRAIIFVEDVGLFISNDWAYGVVDLQMEQLRDKYPGKIVYKIGVAEFIKNIVLEQLHKLKDIAEAYANGTSSNQLHPGWTVDQHRAAAVAYNDAISIVENGE